MDTGKIAIAIVGSAGFHESRLITELAAKSGVEIVSLELTEDDYLKRFESFQISDLAEREAEKTQQEIIKIQNIRKLATISKEVYKPTCNKHHEYVQHIDENGVEYKSIWNCRFCNKPLNNSLYNY